MSRHAAFTFGRFNPPTIGHGLLINKTIVAANGGDYYIFTGQTQDKIKNPLAYGEKISFLRLLFPNQANSIIQDAKIKMVLNAADYLEAKGYTDVTFVCGSDRIEEFTKLLNKWNEIHNTSGKGFKTLNIVSSGEREDGAEGIAGISANKARELAKQGNYNEFIKIIPNDAKLAGQIYNAVRAGMGLLANGNIDTFIDKKAEKATKQQPSQVRQQVKECIKKLIRQLLKEEEYPEQDKAKIIAAKKKTANDKLKEKQTIEKSIANDLKDKKDKEALIKRTADRKTEGDKIAAAADAVDKAAQNLDNAKKMTISAKAELSSIK